MKPILLPAVLLLCAVVSSGCALPRSGLFRGQSMGDDSAENQPAGKTVYVVGHGWHTGIVVNRDDIPDGLWPERDFFFDKKYLEVGWGDEGFYRAQKITPKLIAKAAFMPTPTVLHVVGFNKPVGRFFQASDVIEIELSDEAFEQMCKFIGETYRIDETGEPESLGPGIYGDSQFYRANGSYYFPNTCNVWTAKAMQRAGLPVIAGTSVTAGSVLFQARRLGRSLHQSSPMALIHALRPR